MRISLNDSRITGFRRWSEDHQPKNDDENLGGATPITIPEPPGNDFALEEPPHRPWAVPGVGRSF